MTSALALDSAVAWRPEVMVLDAEDDMPPNAWRAAETVAALFERRHAQNMTVVHASALPETVCMRQLILPDNVVEMRLSDVLPAPTEDATGSLQAWAPSYGQPGPPLELAQRAVGAFREEAYRRCGVRLRPRRCARRILIFGREGDTKRSITNVRSLAHALRMEGRNVVTGFDFAKQEWCAMVRMMSSLDVYITPHGASLAFNVFYMQPSAITVEVYPNVSFRKHLVTEKEVYGRDPSHWSTACPWDYFPSLNVFQALSLAYKCFAASIPEGQREDGRYAPNYPCAVCAPCVAGYLARVDAASSAAGSGACK